MAARTAVRAAVRGAARATPVTLVSRPLPRVCAARLSTETSAPTEHKPALEVSAKPADILAKESDPFRPENWRDLLAEAAEAYPERAGPRNNKRRERSKNRLWGVRRQNKVTQRQLAAAATKKQTKLRAELEKVQAAYEDFGFGPAREYAEAVGDVRSVGLGGRLTKQVFEPAFIGHAETGIVGPVDLVDAIDASRRPDPTAKARNGNSIPPNYRGCNKCGSLLHFAAHCPVKLPAKAAHAQAKQEKRERSRRLLGGAAAVH